MDAVLNVMSFLAQHSAAFIVPPFALILGFIFRAPFKKSFEGALKMAVGFIALDTLIGIIMGALEPAANALATRFGMNFSIIDVGWPTQSAIVFAVPWAMLAITILILINALLVFLNVTKTLNVDFNNHWIFIFYMAATYYMTHNWVFTIIVVTIFWFISLKMADWVYPFIKPYYRMEIDGLTITHAYSILWAPLGFLMDKVWDRVPGIKSIKWDADALQDRFGFFGESIFIGFLIGSIVGAIAYISFPVDPNDIVNALSLGFTTAFFMYVVPRAAELVIAGMAPLSQAISAFVTKKMPGREFHIGLDAAVLVGAPEHVVIGLLTTPIAFLVAFILPHNSVLPMGDVAGLFIFICTFVTNTNRGNIFRGLLNSALILIPISFMIGQVMAPANVAMAAATNFNVNNVNGMMFTSLCVGTTPVGYALYEIAMFFTATHNIIDLGIGVGILVVFFTIWFAMRKRNVEFKEELEANQDKATAGM